VSDDARRVALRALRRIDEGAYANLVLPPLLTASSLSQRDRDFTTELVYGTTRMRRACDFLVDRFVTRDIDADVRNALRLGAYQLHFLGTPAHAAVSATVAVAPGRARGFVNAVLRKVASAAPAAWPNVGTELSYPDWIVNRLAADLGPKDARDALVAMNTARPPTARADGYVQDRASQEVVEVLAVSDGDVVVDVCAGPGGKATGVQNARVVAALDLQPQRAALVAANAARVGAGAVHVAVADGRHPPLRAAAADRVLVDAPCSGLGVLGRRADARWRIEAGDVGRLASLQRSLVAAAMDIVRPGGSLVYSACTLTAAETSGVDDWLRSEFPAWQGVAPGPPWTPRGRGGRLLPQDHGTDGMYVLRLTRP
jgi:16S rRNA (cytosine967-C5)-methyltransferase